MSGKIWSFLIHLGMNDWAEQDITEGAYEGAEPIRNHLMRNGEICTFRCACNELRCDKKYFREVVELAAKSGVNTIFIDLAEGVKYESHPELAVKDAWTKKELADEIAYIRALGIDAYPYMNFSAAHDVWLGEYSKMVSTNAYYKVCADLIKEACELFGGPEYFHIGMGNENAESQSKYNLSVVRGGDLWWHDFNYFVGQVEKNGARAWCNADRILVNEKEYIDRMSREVIQCVKYEFSTINVEEMKKDEKYKKRVETLELYNKLEAAGFLQVPTGTNFTRDDVLRKIVTYTKDVISDKNLLGYLHTTYVPTFKTLKVIFNEGMLDIERAIRTYNGEELSTKRRMLY